MSREITFSLEEISELLHVAPQRLRQWEESFPLAFHHEAEQSKLRYTQTDLATLLVIQRFFENGYSSEQITQHLNGHIAASTPVSSEAHSPSFGQNVIDIENTFPGAENASAEGHRALSHAAGLSDTEPGSDAPPKSQNPLNQDIPSTATLSTATESFVVTEQGDLATPNLDVPHLPERFNGALAIQPLNNMLNEMLGTVANSQQSMLNIQDSIREMLGVIVQDNFNLKTENRKLRDRMLELERTMAEYQRREETRKERLEGRLRAVESTLSAMQQQLAQLVQLQRQKAKRNRFW